MKRLMGIAVVVLALVVTGTEGFARGGRGGGSGGGGQQRMGNASAFSQYGYGGQLGVMQQQMIQNRYRMMQSMQQQRLRDGSCGGQVGSGQTGAAGQMMQNRQRNGQSGNGNRLSR